MQGDGDGTGLHERLRDGTAGAVAAVARLVAVGDLYRRAAWGPDGGPNRANEALLALERAAEELRHALECFENPTGGQPDAPPE